MVVSADRHQGKVLLLEHMIVQVQEKTMSQTTYNIKKWPLGMQLCNQYIESIGGIRTQNHSSSHEVWHAIPVCLCGYAINQTATSTLAGVKG